MKFLIAAATISISLLSDGAARAQPAPSVASAAAFTPTAAQTALIAQIRRERVTELAVRAGPDGGMILNGKLAGRLFVLAVPGQWNREAMLFGQGYATPDSVPGVPADPTSKTESGGAMAYGYGQGLAVGVVAFDKSGIATESGARNALLLRDVLEKLGARRQYIVGGSMGGSIVMSLIELYPNAFDGATSMCGVTEGWLPLYQQLADTRAAYDILTAGTPYALPGEKDLTRSALPTVPPKGDPTPGDTFRDMQKMKLIAPILALFAAAKANPDGREAKIIRQVATIGGFAADPAAIGAPVYSAALGMNDIVATGGGLPIDNIGKVYTSPEMSAEEAAAFNNKIQRYKADPRAIAYARQWHQSTGRFRVPLVTVHQTIDSLVPFSQSETLGRIVARAGNSARLAQYAVPPTRMPLPGGLEGYTHCGFSPEQNIAALQAMLDWVRTGKRPAADAVK